MRSEDWNTRYRSREEDLDRVPAPLLIQAARELPAGRALDLACGAGRNAVWLAELGWEVVAIDGASEAIRILHERDARVDARVLDLETGTQLPFADDSFDLVAVLYYLHRPLFAEAQRLVKPGGIIVAAALMTGRFKVDPGEMKRAFRGFDVMFYREGEIAEIIARRTRDAGG